MREHNGGNFFMPSRCAVPATMPCDDTLVLINQDRIYKTELGAMDAMI